MLKIILSEQYLSLVRIAEVLLVLLLISLLYNYVSLDKETSKTLFIDSTTMDTIVDSLEKNGYTVTLVDKIIIPLETTTQSGWYTLESKDIGRYTFFKHLFKTKAKTMAIRIYAGETQEELIARLAKDVKLDKDKLHAFYKILSRFKEADLFSGHYRVARKAEEKAIMLYLFDESKKILDLFIEETFRNKPEQFELKVLLTIASIIQKESNAIEEMPLISAVIYNRLNKNMKLQMDSTLNYGKYSHTIVTPERIKTDTSYYNTYKHRGLPPYPLGTISVNALRSAMFPDKNKHLFFMLKPDGKHNFCETYDEHLKNIRIFRIYQKKREEEKKALKERENNESNSSTAVSKIENPLKVKN